MIKYSQGPNFVPSEENAKIHSFAFTLKENNSNGGKTSNLLVDTGATSHIINDKSKFVNFDEKFDPSNHVIELADGSKANVVLGKGNAKRLNCTMLMVIYKM